MLSLQSHKNSRAAAPRPLRIIGLARKGGLLLCAHSRSWHMRIGRLGPHLVCSPQSHRTAPSAPFRQLDEEPL